MTDNPMEIRKKQEEMKEKKPSIFLKIKEKISQYKRVINVSRKPSKEEFFSSAKVTGTGIALIGAIGFIIFLMYYLVTK